MPQNGCPIHALRSSSLIASWPLMPGEQHIKKYQRYTCEDADRYVMRHMAHKEKPKQANLGFRNEILFSAVASSLHIIMRGLNMRILSREHFVDR